LNYTNLLGILSFRSKVEKKGEKEEITIGSKEDVKEGTDE
jgi:hypothetical protein